MARHGPVFDHRDPQQESPCDRGPYRRSGVLFKPVKVHSRQMPCTLDQGQMNYIQDSVAVKNTSGKRVCKILKIREGVLQLRR